ncbi:MAG: DNA-directed RNA polymerase subunit H [Candidatus Asgardarchaeia archaeon]
MTRDLQLAPILNHIYVPLHEIMSEEEVKELIDKLGIKPYQLPWIKANDPIVKAIGARPGDVVRITRESPLAGKTYYYRYVVP